MLGIIGAMDEEVAKIKEEMTQVQVTRTAGFLCWKAVRTGRSGSEIRDRQSECWNVYADFSRSVSGRRCD